jgi:transposase
VRCSGHGRRRPDQPAWVRLVPLLPTGKKSGRPPIWSKRQLIDGIRWRTRTGAPWRDVPVRYGPWQTVDGLFRRWQRDGTWQRILTAVQAQADAKGLITWQVGVDSTVASAHQHAAGARKGGDRQREEAGGVDHEPVDHALGRSRGGLSCKLHLAVEGGQRPLLIVVTAGQRGDSPQFGAVLGGIRVPRLGVGRPRTRPDRVLADKACSARANRAWLRRRKIGCTIPEKDDQVAHRRRRARRAAGRRGSTRRPPSCGMRWSAGSTGSSGSGRWLPGRTVRMWGAVPARGLTRGMTGVMPSA